MEGLRNEESVLREPRREWNLNLACRDFLGLKRRGCMNFEVVGRVVFLRAGVDGDLATLVSPAPFPACEEDPPHLFP